jgi:hypothetical protein
MIFEHDTQRPPVLTKEESDAWIASIRAEMRRCDAFVSQFVNPVVGLIAWQYGFSIEVAERAGCVLKANAVSAGE